MQLLHRFSNVVLFQGEYNTVKECLLAAIAADADLRGANLRGADLIGTNLIGANLIGANLIGANLSGTDLSGTDLREADLRGANLRRANLREADLSMATLSGADLSGANLSGADLSGADLSGADLSGTNLIGTNLREAYKVAVFGPMPTSGRLVYAVGGDVVMVRAGCFWGTVPEFRAKIESDHADATYLAVATLLETWRFNAREPG